MSMRGRRSRGSRFLAPEIPFRDGWPVPVVPLRGARLGLLPVGCLGCVCLPVSTRPGPGQGDEAIGPSLYLARFLSSCRTPFIVGLHARRTSALVALLVLETG
ncbi:hypothetical protein U9M48_017148 [Paspalum notatum var. saurae]|uniref:Uncharacterized protein n=1 Tax=Paspalum notatum var. saurae TaxID=547442 RepID=A0AAQ3T892_PASNO